jgi:signal transduction histidine kinase
MVSRIDQAIDGTSMELHTLGLGLKTLMGDVKAASAAERAAQKRLLDLNASLEQRVQARTVELAAARDEALAASRAKEQFLAGMSHELRTPLAGLLGGLEMIEDGLLPPAQQRLLQVSRRSGDALRSVINEVLDYSKLESGRIDLARQPFHPDDVAREAVSLFAAVAARRGLSLTCHCEAGCERPVMGDPARLRQVLLNLIGNALKFTDSGRVDLRLSRLQSPDDRTARLRFAVQDTGIGIDAALQEQLFKPFVQADTTQREARGGSGLGLAISQRLVSAMGGQIGVRSEPGQGSVFAFELDLQFTQDTVPESPSAKDWPTLRGRVLLVEDNAVNRIVAVTMLHRLGLEVDECENGLEAVAALRDTRFDLVLMDSQMPVLDGLSATRRIRGGEAGSASAGVPILAVTANAMDGDAQRCVAAGMNGHLSKPFSIAELARAVAPWLTTP